MAAALPVEDAVRYAIEAADALAHAHDRGVVHRDLKAANAIVSSSGRLKIVDFGLARRTDALMSDTTTMASVVGPGMLAGTPYAMAPEQVRGGIDGCPHRHLGARCPAVRNAGGRPDRSTVRR